MIRAGDATPTDIVVTRTLGAPERRRLSRRRGGRGRSLEPETVPEPAPVTTGRATVIDAARPFDGATEAERWLRGAGDDEVDRTLGILARLLVAHRVAHADPAVRVPRREEAIAVRVGFGTGEQAAEGRLGEARELPAGRSAARLLRRASALRPQEHTAAILADRFPALACEELALRARADLDTGGDRLAALGTGLALETALAELGTRSFPDAAARLAELEALAPGTRSAAASALAGPLGEPDREAVRHALERLEAALRARAARL